MSTLRALWENMPALWRERLAWGLLAFAAGLTAGGSCATLAGHS